jgi:hypothetical protein
MFWLLTHPFAGFFGVRHERQGSLLLAFAVTALFSFAFSMNRIYAGFVVNAINPQDVDSRTEMGAVFLLYFLFCAANWSITCLMDGEGRMRDILTAVGYALLPLVITFPLATLFSQVVAVNEEAFYWAIIALGIGWAAVLAIIGIMTVHAYSLGKALATMLLTFVAMFLIIFIGLMVINMFGQIWGFAGSIYTELLFR